MSGPLKVTAKSAMSRLAQRLHAGAPKQDAPEPEYPVHNPDPPGAKRASDVSPQVPRATIPTQAAEEMQDGFVDITGEEDVIRQKSSLLDRIMADFYSPPEEKDREEEELNVATLRKNAHRFKANVAKMSEVLCFIFRTRTSYL